MADAIRRRWNTLVRASRAGRVLGPVVALATYVQSRVLDVQWYRVLDTRPPGAPPGGEAHTWLVTDADQAAVAAVGKNDLAEVTERRAAGDEVYLAELDGRPVGHYWFRRDRWDEANVEFSFAGDERWAYDLYVDPSTRGRGVAATLTLDALADLADREGVRRMLCVIDVLNHSSLAAAERYGARVASEFIVVTVAGREWVRERTLATGQVSRAWHRASDPLRRTVPEPPEA